ncbi:MAG: hypothetical protein ACT4PU_11235 [Planctomycetota bacterium]
MEQAGDALAIDTLKAGTEVAAKRQGVSCSWNVLQRWEGIVVEVLEERIVAELADLAEPQAALEVATIPVDEISPRDRELLEVGASFYWSIFYETAVNGQLRRMSEIRFRRLGTWSASSIDFIRDQAAEWDFPTPE